jgi:hypothetical protein
MGRCSPRAQALAQGQAVVARQHQVEHQRVKSLAGQQALELGTVGHAAHLEALAAQVALQQGAQFGFVIKNQDAGGGGHGRGGARRWRAQAAMLPLPGPPGSCKS